MVEKINYYVTRLNSNQASIARSLLTVKDVQIPQSYVEVQTSPHKVYWDEAMNEEMRSLMKNDVFERVARETVTERPIGSRWVYALKGKTDGKIERFKARLVAKGYNQKYGLDYNETYCSVVQIMSTRIMLLLQKKNC